MTPVLLSSLVLDSQGIPLVYQGRLRRQYTVELLDIHACVAQALQSGLHDTMTHLIDNWQHGFRYALRTNANEHEVGAYYISLLQQILRDPISDEPLDENAVLGSDGNTYSPISLNVFFLSLPDIYRNRSPLELEFENPAPFVTYPHPHPVVSHLVGWLRRHGALQHSDAPRQILEELLPAVNELTSEARQARVRQVVVDTTQANLREARRRHQQTQDLNQRIDHLFSSFRTELSQMVQPLQQQTQQFEQGSAAQIHALAHRDAAQSNQLQRCVVQMGVQDNQALAASAQNLENVDAAQRRALEQSQQELNRSIAEGRAALNTLAERVQRNMTQVLAPIAQRIDAFSRRTGPELERIAAQNQEAVRQVEGMIAQVDVEIANLQEANLALQAQRESVSAQLNDIERQECILNQHIYQTQLAIHEMKKRNKSGLLNTVALVGASLFATWAIQSVLVASGSSAIGGIAPLKGGARLFIRIPF